MAESPALHQREVVLAALCDQLIDAATDIGENWFTSRTLPARPAELPLGLVRLPPGQMAEQITRHNTGNVLDRWLTVFVTLKVTSQPADANSAEIESLLNALSLQAENALQADTTLGGAAMDLLIEGFFTDLQGRHLDFGDAVLVVKVLYRTLRTDASQPQ